MTAGPSSLHSVQDGSQDLPRHALCLVAAARRQRARGGRRKGAAHTWSHRDGPRLVESGPRPRCRPSRPARRARVGRDRARPGSPHLAPQSDRRAGRGACEPRARARTRSVRRRPRLRAGTALTLVSGAAGRSGDDRGDIPERRTARLSARTSTARPPAWAHRRARRDQRGDGRGGRHPLSRPLPRRQRGNRAPSL